jgi:hypothetical protein
VLGLRHDSCQKTGDNRARDLCTMPRGAAGNGRVICARCLEQDDCVCTALGSGGVQGCEQNRSDGAHFVRSVRQPAKLCVCVSPNRTCMGVRCVGMLAVSQSQRRHQAAAQRAPRHQTRAGRAAAASKPRRAHRAPHTAAAVVRGGVDVLWQVVASVALWGLQLGVVVV